jgi:predicted dienelactone hydrolase
MKIASRAVGGVGLLLLLAVAACAPPGDRAVPVGRQTRAYTDASRTDWSGIGDRPLATTVWYPAARGSVETPWQVGVFRFGRSARDAAFVDAARRPLILLSHGTGGSVAQLAWLAEALAAGGFVVAGVSHHGNTAVEPTAHPAGFVLPWERALDLSRLIDQLVADSAIGPHVDTTRIGAAGFSLGGYTVLALGGARVDFADWQRQCAATPAMPACVLPPEASFTRSDVERLARTDASFQSGVARNALPTEDARVRALYVMAPALVPVLEIASLSRVRAPLRVVLGERDDQVPAPPVVALLSQHQPMASVTVREGVAHYAFLAECSWRGRVFMRTVCADGGSARAAVHAEVAREAIAFFREQLPPHADRPATAPMP